MKLGEMLMTYRYERKIGNFVILTRRALTIGGGMIIVRLVTILTRSYSTAPLDTNYNIFTSLVKSENTNN